MSRQAQFTRADRTRPTVIKGSYYGWVVRGYDKDGSFHVRSVEMLHDAHRIATEWATNGYPEADA